MKKEALLFAALLTSCGTQADKKTDLPQPTSSRIPELTVISTSSPQSTPEVSLSPGEGNCVTDKGTGTIFKQEHVKPTEEDLKKYAADHPKRNEKAFGFDIASGIPEGATEATCKMNVEVPPGQVEISGTVFKRTADIENFTVTVFCEDGSNGKMVSQFLKTDGENHENFTAGNKDSTRDVDHCTINAEVKGVKINDAAIDFYYLPLSR